MADFEYIVADLTNSRVLTPAGQAASFSWVAGQTVKYALKFKQTSSVGKQENVVLNPINLRAAIGREGALPESGWYQVKIGDGPISKANTTLRLDWNASAPDIEEALNAVGVGPGDFECDQGTGAVLVRRVTGEDFKISIISDGLIPASYAKLGGGQKVTPRSSRVDIGSIRFTANVTGSAGDSISIEYTKGVAARPLVVRVEDYRIIVDLGMEAILSEGVVVGHKISTTEADILAAVNSVASQLVSAESVLDANFLVGDVGEVGRSYLTGGLDGSGFEYSFELVQSPVVFSDWAGAELPPKPFITKIQAGGMTGGAVPVKWPDIQALHVPPDFEGNYQFYRRPKFKRSELLTKLDGAVKIQKVANDLMADEGANIKVTNPSNNIAHIEFGGDLLGYPVENLEIVVYSAPPPDITFTLNFSNASVAGLLRDRNSVTLPFEVDATIWADSKDKSKGTRTIKLWKTTATISRNLLWDSMASLPPIDWAARPSPVDYVPFSRTQYLTGQQAAYSAVVGNGSSKVFIVSHNLGGDGTGIVAVSVRENVGRGRLLTDDEYVLRFVDSDSLEIAFEEAPLESGVAVVVIGYGPKSAFTIHTHPIDQIKTIEGDGSAGESLRVILDDYNERIAKLEALLKFKGLLPSGRSKKKTLVPVIGEILPDILLLDSDGETTIASQVVASQSPKVNPENPQEKSAPKPLPGTEMAEKMQELEAQIKLLEATKAAESKAIEEAVAQQAKKAADRIEQEEAEKPSAIIGLINIKGIYVYIDEKDKEKGLLPVFYPAMRGSKYPMLLPAVHAATPVSAAVVPSGFAPGLFVNSGSSALLLPGGGGRKAQNVAPGGLFGGDGRAYYLVRRSGNSNTYHPVEMERSLFRVIIRSKMFPSGSVLKLPFFLDFDFASSSLSAGAGYFLRIEALELPDAMTPSPTAENVGGLGATTLLGLSRISLSAGVKEQRKFSIELTNNSERKSEFTDFGKKSVAPQFPAGDFLLTARLAQWDVDDSTSLPTGQVGIILPDLQLVIEEL
jgi:hypothetical protein